MKALTELEDTQAIVIDEAQTTEITLSDEDAGVIRRRYRSKLNLTHSGQPGRYLLLSPEHVGRVSLPSGALLVVRPKVPVRQLFKLLIEAADLADFHPPPAGLATDDEIFLLILQLFMSQVEGLVAAGLYRAYREVSDDLPLVRGRILLAPQLRLHGELRHRHVCQYAEFTGDIAENRIIAAALRELPGIMRGAAEKETLARTRSLLRHFSEVAVLSPAEALALLPSISFHRLNATYTPVLAVARLILHHLTLVERAGRFPLASFLIDMPRLFERYVAAMLRRHLPALGFRVQAQKTDYLDDSRSISVRPDLLIYPSGEQKPTLVVDTKYKQLEGTRSDSRSADLYQLNAYMDLYGLSRGALLYPRFTSDTAEHLQIRGSAKQLHFLTLDLSGDSGDHLDKATLQLVEQLSALAKPGQNSTSL